MQAFDISPGKIKLIALDLDDTTLSKDGTLSEYNKSALVSAIKAGIEIVVASGRNFTSLPECVTAIPGIRYAVTSNGAAVYDIESGKRICGFFLPSRGVDAVLDAVHSRPGVCLETVVDGTAYCDSGYVQNPLAYGPSGVSPHIADYIRRTRTPVDDVSGFITEHRDSLDCINVVCKSAELCRSLHRELSLSDSGLYLTSSVPHLLEISHRDSGKGSGLRLLCRMLDIPLSATAACGNADNDADMLLAAGIGAAVENATPKCRNAADIIIGSSHEGGVGDFIFRLLSGN